MISAPHGKLVAHTSALHVQLSYGCCTVRGMWPFRRKHRGHDVIANAITEGFKLMSATLDEALSALNVATTGVATEIATLRSELANVATPAQLAKLDGFVAQLTALAADPGNPVPTPTP